MLQDPSEVVLCGTRNTFAIFSKDVLHISWQAQHFGHLRCDFARQAQHFGRVVLRVFANRIVSAARSGDKVQIPWQAWHLVTCHEN